MSVSSIPGLSQLFAGLGSSSLLNGLSSSSQTSNSGTTSSSTSSSSSTGTSSSSSGVQLSTLAQYDLQSLQSVTQQVNGYSDLQSTLSAFQNSLFSVLTLPYAASLSGVTSSNSDVAYLSPDASTNYAVNVTQLAQPQTITTNGSAYASASDQEFATGGTITIQPGVVDPTSGDFTASGNAATISDGDGSLTGIAQAINNSDIGVTAAVTGDQADGYQLQLVGANTGQQNGFQIVGADPSGGSGGYSSLSALTYTAATAQAGTAGFTSNQAAQDAAYTVNGQSYGSPTNLGVPVANGININLLATGSTIISQPQAPSTTINAADSLASTINALFQTFGQLTAANGPLAGQNALTQEIQNDVTLAVTGFYNNDDGSPDAVTTLTQAGFSQGADGSFSVDPNQLASAYSQDPTGVQNLLSTVANAVLTAAEFYIQPDGQVQTTLTSLQDQQTNLIAQVQADEQNTSSTQQSQASAQSAIDAYNLLSLANGGSVSSLTAAVG